MKLQVKKKVVISCVTFETVKIIKPIEYLENVKRVYLLHWGESRTNEKKTELYGAFYEEVERQLKNDQNITDIREIKVKVFLFQEVLKKLLSILCMEREERNEIYINVSGGTSEYGAAATIAAMMVPEVTPFTVATKDYTVSGGDIKIYFDNKTDKPIGLAKTVYNPFELPVYPIEIPPEDLVRGLRVLREKKEKQHITSYSKMIEGIKDAGAWTRKEQKKPRDRLQSDKMYYARHYIDQWIKREWVLKDKRGNLTITDAGLMVTDVFYLR